MIRRRRMLTSLKVANNVRIATCVVSCHPSSLKIPKSVSLNSIPFKVCVVYSATGAMNSTAVFLLTASCLQTRTSGPYFKRHRARFNYTKLSDLLPLWPIGISILISVRDSTSRKFEKLI